MKVVFKVIKAGSGNDVYFSSLVKLLKLVNIDSEIQYYPGYFQYFPFLLKYLNKKTDADVIHSNVEYAWVFKEDNKPLFSSLLHNVYDKEYKKYITLPQKIFYSFVLKPNIKKSLKVSSKLIAISQYTKTSFIKTYGNLDIKVVYCAVDTDTFKPRRITSKDKRFKLLFVGNLIKRKGADLLPLIMKNLGKDYVLYYTSGLRSKVPFDFNLPNMKPLGKLSLNELVDEYNKCDALLFPSRLEGFGYTVAEAISCGKPAVTSNCSSLPEIMGNLEYGCLVKTGDANGFVESIRYLKNAIRIMRKTRQSGRSYIKKRFSFNIISKELEKNYY